MGASLLIGLGWWGFDSQTQATKELDEETKRTGELSEEYKDVRAFLETTRNIFISDTISTLPVPDLDNCGTRHKAPMSPSNCIATSRLVVMIYNLSCDLDTFPCVALRMQHVGVPNKIEDRPRYSKPTLCKRRIGQEGPIAL